MSFILATGLTAFGRHEGADPLGLMTRAARAALDAAGLERGEIDGLITGYATTMPHLMLSSVFAEHFGLAPRYAHAIQLGGATGAAMVMLAHHLISAGVCRNILVVVGENRLTGTSRDGAMQVLAQVGHPSCEVPLGATVPGYYALVASRYMHEFGVTEADLAEFAVLMRRRAAQTPGAHHRDAVSVEEVLASRPIATPLKLLDCCPVSDGGAAILLGAQRPQGAAVKILGAGQAHLHQHVSEMRDVAATGASLSASRALDAAGVPLDRIRYAAIYDSFTITLTMLLEEIGLAPRGAAAAMARAGEFEPQGRLPLNTHGGLLSYGHCGVAGAMAHLVEAHRQMTEGAGERQILPPDLALVHGDGGVLSSHVSLVLERVR